MATTTATTTTPPTFEGPEIVELRSVSASKITSVSLYPSRAEVTRVFKFAVKTGLNQVSIAGLPSVLEAESLRLGACSVEGRGAATIHDVTVSTEKGEHVPTTSPVLETLLATQALAETALARTERAIASLETYLGSVTVEHLDVSKLDSVIAAYDATGARLDARKAELGAQLLQLEGQVREERDRIAVPHENDQLRVRVAIGVFADAAGDVEIALVYGACVARAAWLIHEVLAAVPCATWSAFYDIRVDMDTKEEPISLVYKAAIQQSTGESWSDVPLTLETSTPTFGVGVPELLPWNLDIQRWTHAFGGSMKKSKESGVRLESQRRRRSVIHEEDEESDALTSGYGEAPGAAPLMAYAGASVTSRGNVGATFRVPGMVTIPSDGEVHNFTIVELSLKAAMSWVCVPKMGAKAHILAKITNESEYTLLAGTASVYVDGSFISRSEIPAVSPKESFDCPLGVDPSIRITYHPVLKKQSQSGFYTKSATHAFTQRITVFNTKSIAVERLKIIDQIPTSQNSQIEVKLLSPALLLPAELAAADKGNGGLGSLTLKKSPQPASGTVPQTITVARGVIAQWDGVGEPDCDVQTLGLDRKVNWICSVPSQGKLNLTLDWEVTVSPANLVVVGI
ncbi:unnamed protein product [Mycena citricolor]|uniref:Mucoidy inhibitor A n=1 Tax=Mycena citricolor TaxID=2018698 RepID=A0AAD2JZC7_9AGAR|nr:unnamed protein product [Mycena citricolor]